MNNTAKFNFTVIVPVYNEQDNILRLESELSSFLKNAAVKSCVLFVNDGSKDDSGNMLKDVCARHDDMFYLSFSRNAGLSAAINPKCPLGYNRLIISVYHSIFSNGHH